MLPQDPTSQTSTKKRPAARLRPSLDSNLFAYAAAAGAAGVGMLGLALPAQAQIIYTPAHQVIGPDAQFQIDLNHDGINDFTISNFYVFQSGARRGGVFPTGGGSRHVGSLHVFGSQQSNRMVANAKDYAAALPLGISVGAGDKFSSGAGLRPGLMQYCSSGSPGGVLYGPWADKASRYLGFKFSVGGEVHFGWARLNLTGPGCRLTATLTGYAYETVPNKAIRTGKRFGTDVSSRAEPQPTTLGHLAQGASALSAWRKQTEAESGSQ